MNEHVTNAKVHIATARKLLKLNASHMVDAALQAASRELSALEHNHDLENPNTSGCPACQETP